MSDLEDEGGGPRTRYVDAVMSKGDKSAKVSKPNPFADALKRVARIGKVKFEKSQGKSGKGRAK